jgi:hypothetical protein
MSNPLTPETLAEWTIQHNARLAATKAARPAKPKSPRQPRPLRNGDNIEVYNLVTGKVCKPLDKPRTEKLLRTALSKLTSDHDSGLRLSQAIDACEIAGLKPNHPLVERAADKLEQWERDRDAEFLAAAEIEPK